MDQMKKRNYMNQSEDFQSWFPYIVVHNRGEQKNWKTGKKKPWKKTEPNQFEPVFVLKNRTELKPVGWNWFRFFLKKNSVWLFFFLYKNRTEPKMITPGP